VGLSRHLDTSGKKSESFLNQVLVLSKDEGLDMAKPGKNEKKKEKTEKKENKD